MSDQERAAKIEAARQSLAFVEAGMKVGLGSGTTAT
jgi:ribose 5-phosphate isomerase